MPTAFEALDIVSREIAGAIPATTISARASGVSIGETVKVPVVPDMETENAGASASLPSGAGQTFGNVNVTITKSKRAKPILWTGEDENTARDYIDPLKRNQFEQAFRAVINEMERDVCAEALQGAIDAGNIIGTAGTNPFASNLNKLTETYKMLQDKGAPMGDLQMILNTTSGMNLRNLTQLQKVNEAGNGDLLRQGVIGNLFGMNLRETAGFNTIASNVPATGYVVAGAVTAGATEITVDTGVGKILKGSLISFGTDTKRYCVAEEVASGGTKIKLTSPVADDIADDTTITVGASYLPNVAFTRGSIILANRLPFVPAGGDMALDRYIMTDPLTGIPFEIALWGGAYQNSITITSCWGVKNIKGEHSVALIG